MQLDDEGFEIEPSSGVDPTSTQEDIETRARAQGWRPLEEYSGDPAKWRDAAEFLRVGQERAPILRRNLEAAERRIRDLERETADKLARVERLSEAALEREKQRLAREYDARVRFAIQHGDSDEYEAAGQEYGRQMQDLQQRVQPPPQQQRQDVAPEAQEWVQRNSWFQEDPALQMEAQGVHMALLRDHPHMPLRENLQRVTQIIQSRHPHLFGLQQQDRDDAPRPPAMAGGVRLNGGQKSFAARLPSDVRPIAERMVARGLYKTVEEYAKAYFEGA